MSSKSDLFQELILEHHRNPRNYYLDPNPDIYKKGISQLCGDEIEVFCKLEKNKIVQISFYSKGCSIARASASIMTEMVKGKDIIEIKTVIEKFQNSITDNLKFPLDKIWNIARGLEGIKNFPARKKCVLLAWKTLQSAFGELT